MHPKSFVRIMFALTLLLIGGLVYVRLSPSSPQLCCNSTCFTLELAQTPEERQIWLMFRETLPDNAGMLFLFEQTDFHSFRMKNTLIPLEMLRLDADFQVVDMQHAEPCKADPCPLYVPVVPAKYVLEMNAGTGREARIGVGMKCKLVAGNN